MDGTLVDTEPYWMTAETELVTSFGGTWSAQDGLTLVGSGMHQSASILRSRGVDLELDDIVDRLVARVRELTSREIPWRPGARELIAHIQSAGIQTALVTMSMKPLADHIAEALPGSGFDAIVTGGDVQNPKPHPEPYLRAADLLTVEASDCVAIEDSLPGLQSAVDSGAVVIGVRAHVPLTPAPSYTLWTTLKDVTVDDIARLFAQRRASAAVTS